MEKKGTKHRILETSRRLFLEKGYAETGLNQIVQEAETVKASLYQHFESKEELGREILKLYSEENLIIINSLMKKYPNPIQFLSSWTKVLQREARQNKLFGCGMANFRAQIGGDELKIKSEIESISKTIISTLEAYLSTAKQKGMISEEKNISHLSRQIFITYEGVLQTFRLLNDPKILSELDQIGSILLK
jgi:TetR/AcrR family transcriptional repressor of lmrAB and yxaGH operons